MSATQPYPEQYTFPPVDRDAVAPTVDDVALLVATRTMDSSSTQLGVFTDDTNPTDVQVQGLIDQAITLVLTPLPDYLPESLYGRIRQAVALQAAILEEISFYREQANAGSIVALSAQLATLQRAIQEDTGGAGVSSRVDSIVVRSTMADYDPYYVMPPPPVVGVGNAWAGAQPPTGPAQVTSISPPAWSVSNAQSVVVAASGLNLAADGLVAHLQDSSGHEVTTETIADPSGQGTMLVATFPAPDPATPLGVGWFYFTADGVSYGGALEPWEWVA